MNKAKLKAYAPQARKDFIAAVTARAHRLGLAERDGQLQIAPPEVEAQLAALLRIQLDPDDGVKVNYGKFGDLLAEVKAVTGGSGDD
jgi:hypothetical protein